MDASIPAGTEIARPFLPAKDFDLSKRFYEALGFAKVLDDEVAVFRIGAGGFVLQNYFQKDWAENCMMQLMVDDLDAWWRHVSSLDLPHKIRRACTQTADGPAMGPTDRLRDRPLRCAVACGATSTGHPA